MPATSQCTFSKVMTKSVAGKARRRPCSRDAPEQLGQLLDAGAARQRVRHSSESGVPSSVPARKLASRPTSASRIPAMSSGPRPRPRRSRAAARRRRRPAGRRPGSAARPPGTRRPCRRARRGRGRPPRGSAAAAPPSRAAARASGAVATYGISSIRSPSPRCSAHSRSLGRKPPTKRARRHPPDDASASRNGFGSRLPKKLPACVMRKRPPAARWYSSPAKSSKSEPFEIVTTGPRGSSARASSAIASETATIASAGARPAGRARPRPLLQADGQALARCGAGGRRASRAGRRPSARRSPSSSRRRRGAPSPGGEVVMTASMPSRGRPGSPPGWPSAFQVTLASGTSSAPEGEARLRPDALEPLRAVQLLGRPRPRGPM